MRAIYAVCPVCTIIETVSDYCRHIVHHHERHDYVLMFVRHRADAEKQAGAWTAARKRWEEIEAGREEEGGLT